MKTEILDSQHEESMLAAYDALVSAHKTFDRMRQKIEMIFDGGNSVCTSEKEKAISAANLVMSMNMCRSLLARGFSARDPEDWDDDFDRLKENVLFDLRSKLGN